MLGFSLAFQDSHSTFTVVRFTNFDRLLRSESIFMLCNADITYTDLANY